MLAPAVLGASLLVTAVPAQASATAGAAVAARPNPREEIPAVCRRAAAFEDWYTARMCEEAWRVMYGPSKRIKRPRAAERRPHRRTPPDRTPRAVRRTPAAKPAPPVKSPSPRVNSPTPTARPSGTAAPPPVRPRAGGGADEASALQPLLLLGLLIPAAAGIAYPLRRRIYAAAGAALPAPAVSAEGPEQTVHFTYRPSIDPFAVPVLGLAGPGAADTARVMALTALEECRDTALVVVPRPDATALFGLAEDEWPDETAEELFIPGNLDAALAYLETELAARRDGHGSSTRRLLLVADIEAEAERVLRMLDRHPEVLSAVLLGDWPGARVAVDDEGLVRTPPGLTIDLPERVPAMSRGEALDRLRAAVEAGRPRKRRPKRP
ncbi:hypothetical protein ACFQU9_22525 [Actinomadura namibiensis]|uniref:Uncharacterized protein n=1 Tax=Actinomadura namibiensis TaxID=182080 RepID=A0A7W3LZ99_ACTNM|nr:hypothetical protein [Actinomadura namibiensis]MBA8956964.1 hypothetical protein [Actinomadura namibiensis]